MTKPRQLAPTVGPAHGGVEFLKGFFLGIEKLVIDHMKSQETITHSNPARATLDRVGRFIV